MLFYKDLTLVWQDLYAEYLFRTSAEQRFSHCIFISICSALCSAVSSALSGCGTRGLIVVKHVINSYHLPFPRSKHQRTGYSDQHYRC
jgi:hypothetical protein